MERHLVFYKLPRLLSYSLLALVVGDIVVLNSGDKIPADGLFVSGSDVTVDESDFTGETDDMKKTLDKDIFLLSGKIPTDLNLISSMLRPCQ